MLLLLLTVLLPGLLHGAIAQVWVDQGYWPLGPEPPPLLREEGLVYLAIQDLLDSDLAVGDRLEAATAIWRSDKWPHGVFVQTALWTLAVGRTFKTLHEPFVLHLIALLGGVFALGCRLGGQGRRVRGPDRVRAAVRVLVAPLLLHRSARRGDVRVGSVDVDAFGGPDPPAALPRSGSFEEAVRCGRCLRLLDQEGPDGQGVEPCGGERAQSIIW